MSDEGHKTRSTHALMTDPARRKPAFVREEGMDKTLAAIMRLAMEISVLRDRLDTHEALAEQSGAYSSADVEAYRADPERAARRAMGRKKLIEALLHDLA